MSPLRTLSRGNWLALCAVVLASALVGLVFFLVVDGAQARQDGVDQAQAQARQAIDTRQAASRRIDRLADDLAALQTQNGQLTTTVQALAEQVRQMGGSPVATLPARPAAREAPRTGPAAGARMTATSSPTPRRSPPATRPPTATRSPSPAPSRSPSPTCLLAPITGCRLPVLERS